MRPKKITLRQAWVQHDRTLLFYCGTFYTGPGSRNGFCGNRGKMDLTEAILRWGADLRLDEVPARCTRCGRCDGVDVVSYHRVGPGGFRPGEGPNYPKS